MKASIYLRIEKADGTIDRRVVEYLPPKDGLWNPQIAALEDAYYIGETAKGMAADMLGGLALTAFSSPASRARLAREASDGA